MLALGGCTAETAPDSQATVPVANRSGEIVGQADAEALERAMDGGEPAEVISDGRVVGYFDENGFTSVESPGG
jgi:hypothetical protein